MTSRSVSANASQAPRVHVAPKATDGFGDLAGILAADYELKPDPWQQIVLDDWLAVSRGKWASLTCGLAVPRQNGKNAVIEIRELFGMIGRGEKILHTAHEIKTARKAFKRLQYFFGTQKDDPAAKFPELIALVTEVRNTNGQEAIYLKNGGSVEVVARSKNSGRGFTVDVLVMDEAQEMSEEDLEALMPTTSAAPKGDPQWIFTGTPPGPLANGEIFTRVRTEALSGSSKRLSWHEWSAEPGANLDDRDAWRLVNPALLTGRLQFEVIEGERARFSDEGFGRERLGIWAEDVGASDAFGLAQWLPSESDVVPTGAPVFFVTIAAEMRSATIAAATIEAGVPHVELADHRSGTSWLTERLRELHGRFPLARVACYRAGPVAAWQPPVGEFGMDLQLLTSSDAASAYAHVRKLAESAAFTHSPDPIVNAALRCCVWRDMDGGGAVPDWRKSTGDISPFVAAVGALWLLETQPSYDVLMSVF